MKQEFALEKARVRTFRRLENIFALCVLAYVYATRFLRRAKGFRKILKFLSDNLETVSAKTHALLAGIRALVKEARIRFISGRPRKRPDGRQMLLPGLLNRAVVAARTGGGTHTRCACGGKPLSDAATGASGGRQVTRKRRFRAHKSWPEKSPAYFRTRPEKFFAQCFRGPREKSG